MKVALVQDWLTEIGGAEKVFAALLELFPEADIFTLTSQNKVLRRLGISKDNLKESFIAGLPSGRKNYRNYLPLFSKAIESFDFDGYDLIISSSSSVAKGILTSTKQLHICYCHSPVRYAWDLYNQYLNESGLGGRSLKSWYVRHVLHKLRIWDVASANRVDSYIANSTYISKRIKKVYRRESTVIYPPVNVNQFQLGIEKGDYFLAASRLVPYKKIDLIVKAFNQLPDKKLIVAGDGPEMKKIKRLAGFNVKVLGFVTDDQMLDLMQKAKGFVFAADEDFGIIPVEAQSCGTPVIALGTGGTKETVINGVTGVHFNEQTVESLTDALIRFEEIKFSGETIRQNAERFSKNRFLKELKEYVSNEWNDFEKGK